jgi:hypothetical protein
MWFLKSNNIATSSYSLTLRSLLPDRVLAVGSATTHARADAGFEQG